MISRGGGPPASTTQSGLVQLATDGEVAAGKAVQANDSRLVGGGGGAVTSVNGEVGIVVLDATDVGADATGTSAAGIAAHLAAFTHENLPTTDQKSALMGTSGGAGDGNRYVTNEDSRMTNSRTPTAHATSHDAGGSDAMAIDAAAATGSLRTLGTAATQAAAGNDSRFPVSGEKAALAGTSGTPGVANQYVTTEDSRMTDSRTPTAHAASHKHGGSDEIATATAAANAIPKASGTGTLDTWISPASDTVAGILKLAAVGGAQSYSALLTVTAALAGAGFLAFNGAAGANVRTLTEGTGITISNPTGATGNPTISSSGLGSTVVQGGLILYYGTGEDGDLVFNGTDAVTGCSRSGSTYTLTRRLYARHATVSSGVRVISAGFYFRGTGTLTLNDGWVSIDAHGTDNIEAPSGGGATTAAATEGTVANSNNYCGGGSGTAGRMSQANGVAGGAVVAGTCRLGGAGGAGGGLTGGGVLTNRNGGAGGAGGTAYAQYTHGEWWQKILSGDEARGDLQWSGGGGGGAGGQSYTTDDQSVSGQGGGGAGILCLVFADIVNNGTGNFGARGGAAGNAHQDPALVINCANGGGGGGGGGASVVAFGNVTTGTLPNMSVSGGNGSNAVNGGATPTGVCTGGAGGSAGRGKYFAPSSYSGADPTCSQAGGTGGLGAGVAGPAGADGSSNSDTIFVKFQ